MSASRVLLLSSDVTAARRARAFVRETLGEQVDDDDLQDVLIVTSELVTNAVMHTGSASQLEVRPGDDEVELRVSDGDPRAPARRTLVGLQAQGRGLALLGALAQRWGVDEREDGKTVWAVLRLHRT